MWGVWVGLLFQACLCYGAASGRDEAREKKVDDELRQIDASLLPLLHRANDALDAEKYGDAAGLYQQLHDAAPSFEPASRRLGASLCALGKRKEGLDLGRQAVALHRSEPNLASLAYNLAGLRGGKSSDAECREALQLLREARALPDGTEVSDLSARAQIALRIQDFSEFKLAVSDLRTHFPDTFQTHYFAAIDAAVDEKWIAAEREINRAHALGLSDDATEQFLGSGVRSRALGWKVAIGAAGVIGVWLTGLAILFGLGFILSRATLRSAERADPNIAISSAEQRMRRLYRVVLNVAGVYYYLSLPVVVLMVVGACAAIIFFFITIGWLPIKLMLILGIGAFVTITAMVRSLFLKPSSDEPGRPLTRAEAPALWSLAEEVASDLHTRPIDEIQITPGTDLAVFERGNWRQKMRDDGKRILLLGTGVLNGFQQNDFRSVLAHEYGHFSHRDTAGGEVALRVQNDMLKFYVTMVRAGQATRMNLAFHFLKTYHFIFRRISHGATRLQEILADRVAAQAYGSAAFEHGLKHVIRRGLEFSQVADREINAVIKSRDALQNLYEVTTVDGASLEKEYDKAMQRATTEDDTHPSPSDRFRMIAAVLVPSVAEKPGEVWELFSDRAGITLEMLSRLEKQIAPYRPKAG